MKRKSLIWDRMIRPGRSRRHALVLTCALLVVSGVGLGGCTALLVTGAATGGVVAAQERSVGDAVDDFTVRSELNRLFFEENLDLYQDVSFNVTEGRVLLKGAVELPDSRIRASELAWQARGVREVNNEIQVTDRGGIIDYARDTWISAQLRTGMLIDKEILSINYNVETINGVIYLAGIAQDQPELDRVLDRARNIQYVRQVVSHVVMKDDPRREPTP